MRCENEFKQGKPLRTRWFVAIPIRLWFRLFTGHRLSWNYNEEHFRCYNFGRPDDKACKFTFWEKTHPFPILSKEKKMTEIEKAKEFLTHFDDYEDSAEKQQTLASYVIAVALIAIAEQLEANSGWDTRSEFERRGARELPTTKHTPTVDQE